MSTEDRQIIVARDQQRSVIPEFVARDVAVSGAQPALTLHEPPTLKLRICDTYYLEQDDEQPISQDFSELQPSARLKLPAGKFVVFVRAVLTNKDTASLAGVDCRLFMDGVAGNDWCTLFLSERNPVAASPTNSQILSMMKAGDMGNGGFAELVCRSGNPGVRISMVHMSAFRADCLKFTEA
jgi:hypothetical protein